MTAERWRLCTQHPGYLVSDRGRVRRIGGRILKPQRSSRGYLKVNLGRKLQRSVHVLVAEAFHGRRPAGHHTDHLNFDRLDNRAVNLRWLFAADNSVRWQARTSDGRNVWSTPDDVPESHVPLSDDERTEIAADLTAAGWTP